MVARFVAEMPALDRDRGEQGALDVGHRSSPLVTLTVQAG